MIKFAEKLEKMSAEWTALGESLQQLQAEIDAYFAIAEREQEQVTPNEQRKEVIEKVKAFIEDRKTPFGNYRIDGGILPKYCSWEFVVNAKKRTVVALLKGINSGVVLVRGIAKCDPTDVFNEHIGKAIALGRALKIDVSEFENAPQPTEIVVGMRILDNLGRVVGVAQESDSENFSLGFVRRCNYKITDDTNAQY